MRWTRIEKAVIPQTEKSPSTATSTSTAIASLPSTMDIGDDSATARISAATALPTKQASTEPRKKPRERS